MAQREGDPATTEQGEYGDLANEYQEYETFDEMGLKEPLLRGIYAYGFEKPSAIQKRGIKPIVDGHDTIGQAQSGTGKTATFAISTLERIDATKDVCQALIMAPTRELASQIHKVTSAFGVYLHVRCHLSIGGTDRRREPELLKLGQHVVVGTPGRVGDILDHSHLRANNIRLFILDEADEMLSKGFKEQIYTVFRCLPGEVQVCLFSATMPAEILELTSKFMRNPKSILVKAEELTLEGIRQYYIDVQQQQYKVETLIDIYSQLSLNQTIVYCNAKKTVDQLAYELDKQDFTVCRIHADMMPDERNKVMTDFREANSRVMIATDVMARGIDVQAVSVVINYDLPNSLENYLHRIGRSGRFGRKGTAINLCTSADMQQLKDIEQHYNTQIGEMPENLAGVLAG
eukprot:Selendium_serpulae@DN5851_c0_g1_i1.p2